MPTPLLHSPLRFSLLPNGSLVLSKLLHGHVSRVRSIDVQNGRILSGSDDRSLKVGTKLIFLRSKLAYG